MKNLSDTEAYSYYDHCVASTIRTVSRVVGIRKLTQPFWNRWRASDIEERYLFEFLQTIRSFDDWPSAALRLIDVGKVCMEEELPNLPEDEKIRRLRRFSYLCNLGQWGILPLSDEKRITYLNCRDSYVRAERLAFRERYQRLVVQHNGRSFHANVHLPKGKYENAPVVVIIHGIDGCKEEHLATELALAHSGLVAVGFDGPGQAEALLLDGMRWTPDFPSVISAVLDAIEQAKLGNTKTSGLLGISFGGLWAYQAASEDDRITAIYDLAAPINSDGFARVPFLLKTKICQVSGARREQELKVLFSANRIDNFDLLRRISADIRMVHGGKDRVVSRADKNWLRGALSRNRAVRLSWKSYEDGDHACTNHLPDIRNDACAFFTRSLT